ncbi:MAG: recombinase family protein [Romboutsia timonensis]
MSKVIAYCRVSTKGQTDNNSLEQQKEEILNRYANAIVFEESYSGKTSDRPIFNKVMEQLNEGDTLVVTKLDRFCRNVKEGLESIEQLMEKGIRIHILNMGLIEDTPMGKLIVTNLLAFAEFERNMIIERTQNGKAIAKQKEGYKEGRPKAHSNENIENALKLLTINGGNMSYNEVAKLTKISKSTLIRENNKRKLEGSN